MTDFLFKLLDRLPEKLPVKYRRPAIGVGLVVTVLALCFYYLPQPAVFATRAVLPKGCAPMAVKLSGAESGELHLLFIKFSKGDLLRCNPQWLRDLGVSDLTDVRDYTLGKRTGTGAVVSLNAGSATVAIPENEGSNVLAYRCQPEITEYLASWGSLVPTKLSLRAIPVELIDEELRRSCVVGGYLNTYLQ